MVEQVAYGATKTELVLGKDVASITAERILTRLQQLEKWGRLLPGDEQLLGIFKALGHGMNHIVVTNYRVFGVRRVDSFGNLVFANELTKHEAQSVSTRKVKRLFKQASSILDVEKNGKNFKYAIVRADDGEIILRLVKDIKSSDTLTSLIESQNKLLNMEKIKRKKIESAEKQQKAQLAAIARQERKQAAVQAKQERKDAAAEAKQLAITRANSGHCPRCGSNNLQAVHSSTKQGFSDSSACGGCCIFGPLGLLCGFCGSGKTKSESYRMCLNCGNKF